MYAPNASDQLYAPFSTMYGGLTWTHVSGDPSDHVWLDFSSLLLMQINTTGLNPTQNFVTVKLFLYNTAPH